jgi:hypothetical protein
MKLWRAAALAPALLGLGVLAPTPAPVANAPVSHATRLPPCPTPSPHARAGHSVGASQTMAVTIPALPGVNCH